MAQAVNEFTRGFIPFNPNDAFNYGLAMPAAYGFTEAQVRRIGVPAAYKAAKIIARQKKRAVLVPVPGSGKSFVARPPKKKYRASPFVARRKPGVLTAQTRAPLPDTYLAVGQRSAMPPKALWKTAVAARKRAQAAARVERQRDAVAARRSSNVVPGRVVKPTSRQGTQAQRLRVLQAIAKATKAKAHSKGVYDEYKIAMAATLAVRNAILAQARRIGDNSKVQQWSGSRGVKTTKDVYALMRGCLRNA